MAEEKERFEKKPKKDEETRRQETDHIEEKPGENWEREKQQSKEIVSKALNKVKSRLEDQ